MSELGNLVIKIDYSALSDAADVTCAGYGQVDDNPSYAYDYHMAGYNLGLLVAKKSALDPEVSLFKFKITHNDNTSDWVFFVGTKAEVKSKLETLAAKHPAC